MNNFQRIIDLMLAVICMFYLPLCYISYQNDGMKEELARKYVKDFVGQIQEQGQITISMYELLTQKLWQMGIVEEIELILEQKRYVPVYDKEELNNMAFHGEIMEYTEILDTEECFRLLFQYEKIRMYKEDCFKIAVTFQRNSAASLLSSYILGEKETKNFCVKAAGYIRNESWRNEIEATSYSPSIFSY